LALFLAAGFLLISQPVKNFSSENKNIQYVAIAGQKVKVDAAITKGEKEKGLSGRTGLEKNTGMLFIFDQPGKYPFWMKDMNFSIDIIWLSADKKVMYIKKDARPESYPEAFGPEEDAKYVLEVPAGFSEENNLQRGDTALFTY
jgi:uncharacterized membrane protein (UPF0127 family)